MNLNMVNHKTIVFISGLHRSGTSFLAKLLNKNEDVSSFQNTGFPEDEGQFLQSLMPISDKFIAPGKFAFNKEAHFTTKSKLLQNKQVLINDWLGKWDLAKPILLEKSPTNLIRTRFLQEVFPNSKFITIIRHPIANSYAVKKWTNDFFLEKLIKHWITAHVIYYEDRKYLKNELFISYEDFIHSIDKTLSKISNFLDIEVKNDNQFKNKNEFYFDLWRLKGYSGLKYFGKFLEKKYLIEKYETKINKFDYSLIDLDKHF